MKRFLLLLLVLVFLCSCGVADGIAEGINDALSEFIEGTSESSDGYAFEDYAEQMKSDRIYYNGYFGVKMTVPAGWWLYEEYPENFGDSATSASDPGAMDIMKDEISYYMQLLDCANLQYSNKSNHIGVVFEAEKLLDSSSVEDYLEYNAQYMSNRDGDYDLVSSSTVSVSGRDFVRQTFLVPQEDADYNEMVLTGELKDGYFLTIYVSYWPSNHEAEEYAIDLLNKNLVFYK